MTAASTQDEIKRARLAQLRAEELNARLLTILNEYAASLPYEVLRAVTDATAAREPGTPVTSYEFLALRYQARAQ